LCGNFILPWGEKSLWIFTQVSNLILQLTYIFTMFFGK
jgi:hypothetical protein